MILVPPTADTAVTPLLDAGESRRDEWQALATRLRSVSFHPFGGAPGQVTEPSRATVRPTGDAPIVRIRIRKLWALNFGLKTL